MCAIIEMWGVVLQKGVVVLLILLLIISSIILRSVNPINIPAIIVIVIASTITIVPCMLLIISEQCHLKELRNLKSAHVDMMYTIAAQSLGVPETEDNYSTIRTAVNFSINFPSHATTFLPDIMNRKDAREIISDYRSLTEKIDRHQKTLKILCIIL